MYQRHCWGCWWFIVLYLILFDVFCWFQAYLPSYVIGERIVLSSILMCYGWWVGSVAVLGQQVSWPCCGFTFINERKFNGLICLCWLLAKRLILLYWCCCSLAYVVRVCVEVIGCIEYYFHVFMLVEPLVIYCWAMLGGVGFLVMTGVMRDRLAWGSL